MITMSSHRSHSTKAIKILDRHMVTVVEVQGLMVVAPQESIVKEAQDHMAVEEGLTAGGWVPMVAGEVKDLGV